MNMRVSLLNNLIIPSLLIMFVLTMGLTPANAVLCYEQVVYVNGDDEMLTLCEQDDLWSEIDSIWKYIETNVSGSSSTSTSSSSAVPDWLQESDSGSNVGSEYFEQLSLENQKLSSKIADLEAKITQLEKTVEALSENPPTQTSQKLDCWFFC